MAHVFISYKRRDDGDFADILKRKLEEASFETWMDSDIAAGENWREAIDNAIKDSFALIVIMTPAAKSSEYVTYEWAFALGAGKMVIPVLLKPTDLHPRFEVLHYLDFTNLQARPWEELIKRLQKVADEYSPHTVPVPRDAPPAVANAVAAFDSPDSNDRAQAFITLSKMNHPTAIEALVAALQHLTRDVRLTAVKTLGEKRATVAVPELVEALQSKDRGMRSSAAVALGLIGDAAAVQALVEALSVEDNTLHRNATAALLKIGAAAVPGLVKTLCEKDHAIRNDVTEVLVTMGAAAVPELIRVLSGADKHCQARIVKVLERTRTPEAREAVNKWRSSHDE